MYFQFLNSKLQKLIRKKFNEVDIRLTDNPVYSNPPKKYYSCTKKGYKRYVCECAYQKYSVKTSDKFRKTFDEIMRELHNLSPSPDNCEKLEKRYQMPMKLIGFLISCHLMPTEIFGFLLWWYVTDNPLAFPTTTTLESISSDEDSSSSIFGEE